jgi:hypothetical protein
MLVNRVKVLRMTPIDATNYQIPQFVAAESLQSHTHMR